MSIAVLLLSAAPVLAAVPGDGERLAATCAGCHGTRGAAPGSHIPVIGGQGAAYLKKTLTEYRDGTRPGGVMANLSKGYSDKQIGEISDVVASWKWQNTPLAATPKGKKLSVSTAACAACHGKKGEGTVLAPHINGQAPEYLKEALLEYKNGTRNAPAMALLKGMSDADIDSLVKNYTRK
ncbi:MAG: c-type cytochrome [Desulfuromonadaceae bacterium]|nr:c-type cytochrome [Desulfuromonadaceae bacterium]